MTTTTGTHTTTTPNATSLLEALNRWKTVKRRRPRTVEAYDYSIRRWARDGIRLLADVTVATVGDFMARRAEKTTAPTANLDLAALCSILSVQVDLERFSRRTLRRIRRFKLPREKRPRFSAHFLLRDDAERLALSGRELRWPHGELLVRLGLLSGLRAGELARLRWEDVSLPERFILVREGKTGPRRVPVCAELLAVLAAHVQPSGYVFKSGSRASRNAFATAKTLWRFLTRIREIACIPEATFHILRHTRASWWLQAGAPPAKVAFWLGHSLEVCLDYYGGLLQGYDPDCDRAAV